MAIELGQIIDAKYRVRRRIGEGGMGTVYEGENERIGRRVAIKVLHAQVASMPEFVERFEREARAAARIGSPHVCDVLDLGDLPNGDRYIVMEYLDGVSFEDRLEQSGKLSPAELAPIAFELLDGLGMMHGARVIHRDLKPANVFLAKTPSGRGETVKILDFGVAKLLPFGGEVGTMTQTGTMMGTPLYMSPEQARGARDVDGRTDIYAASVMFYRALAGELPYNAATLNELLFKIVLEDPRPLREVAPEVDASFAAIIHKGLARDIEQRFATARQFQEAIAAWGRDQGRASLSFALTLPSEPLPRLPALGDGPGSPRPVASAVTANAGGTPIAWSEDSPDQGTKSPTAARAPANASTLAAVPAAEASSGQTLASAASEPRLPLGDTGASKSEAGASSAQATTGPTHVADPTNAASAQNTGGTRSKRGVVVGAAGASAVALLAFLAFGRGGSEASTGVTQAAGPEGSVGAALAEPAPTAPPGATEVAPTPAEVATAATPDAAAEPGSPAPTATAVAAAPAPRHDPAATATTATARVSPRPTTTTAAPTAAPPATVAAPTATPAPQPTTSGRKFRTKLD